MTPIISATELHAIFEDKNLVILDARAGKDAKEQYLENHIKGARFINLDQDLANVNSDPAIGGRHPLPEVFDCAKTLSDFGISENSHVVVYDDKNGANAAARCWWMLRAFGIVEVQVLNGGLQSAEHEGIKMNSGEEHYHASTIKIPNNWLFPIATMQEVEEKLLQNSATVIDVRDAYRFRGDSEPIDLVAGHIPGAINIPFSENLDESGRFLSPEILSQKYSKILNRLPQELIVHCGSGVTACHTILAMKLAGLPIPKLYVGSWSEWSRNGKPIGKSS